jgi:glucosamine--fructose-6-phosphate aminotransferase (isomerizing)
MCGIVGYVGRRPAVPILLEALKRLEYRGYDSAGIAFMEDNRLTVYRSEGKLSNLAQNVESHPGKTSSVGLGHTRWATHGPPIEKNAHPHRDCEGEITVVHNGIIENYYVLKELLKSKGHSFKSDTDTEVIAHLIEEHLNGDLLSAVSKALKEVRGSYALGVMWAREPETIVAARNQSPLVLGLGTDEVFLASDVPAFLPWTSDSVFLEDGEIVRLGRKGIEVFALANGSVRKKNVQRIEWDAGMAEKAGFRHFMLKEIYEQPEAILNTYRGRISPDSGELFLPEIKLTPHDITGIQKILFAACGTSYHAGLVARYLFERWVKIPVEVELGSEFRYRDPSIDRGTLTIPITQSGETADTLASLRKAKELGSKTISICNVLGSTATRESDGTVYTHAGPEIGVASTKAFTSQLTALILLTLHIGRARGTISDSKSIEVINDLIAAGKDLARGISVWHEQVKTIALQLHKKTDFLYLGRNILYPVALEGALKLKEISYIHAEGYPAGELKHGPIALVDPDLPVVALIPKDHVYEKMISNLEEVRSRHGILVVLGEKGDTMLEDMADYYIPMPRISWAMSPLIYTVPLQLIAYEIAALRGCDIDQPRNLAKSVTVE